VGCLHAEASHAGHGDFYSVRGDYDLVPLRRFHLELGSAQKHSNLTFSVALVAIFRSNKIPDQPGYFRRWITDNFQILAFVQFLVTLYTYPLWVELLVIPFVTFVGGMIAVGARDPKTKPAVNFLKNTLAVLALGFFGFALYMTIVDFETYVTVQTWRDLYTPIVLTVLFLPFIFVLYVTMSYEAVFVSLAVFIKDKRVRRSAKWMAVFRFGGNVELMRRWQRHIGRCPPATVDELRAGIREVKEARHREKKQPYVPSEIGWAPGSAKQFLNEVGLSTRDYHRSFEDEWFASSAMIEIGNGVMPNNIAYYIEGHEAAAKVLKVKLNVNEPSSASIAESRFKKIGEALIMIATGRSDIDIGPYDIDANIGIYHIRVIAADWPNGIPGGYDRMLTIGIRPSAS
jgi:hypothetical protein